MINAIGAAISALKSLEKKLGVTANNTANVNTQGFKASSASLQEVSPQNVSTTAGTSQVGRGTTLAGISRDFSGGTVQSTTSATDMAIGGDGFFIVKDQGGADYYTRDGEFHFDRDSRFVTSSGEAVQGWGLDPVTGEAQGTIRDVTLSSFTSPPAETTHGKMIINLNSNAENKSAGLNALASAWDGDNPDGQYIGGNAYEYSTPIKVFDGVGSTHDITFYFDKGDTASKWEYIITANPAEDKRPGAGGDNLGLLARGTLVFNDTGDISDITMDINDGAVKMFPQILQTVISRIIRTLLEQQTDLPKCRFSSISALLIMDPHGLMNRFHPHSMPLLQALFIPLLTGMAQATSCRLA